jgi:hypothetical protein
LQQVSWKSRLDLVFWLILSAPVFIILGYQNCGQPVGFDKAQAVATAGSLTKPADSPLASIDSACANGAPNSQQTVFPPFVPLRAPAVPATCSIGFELNNLMGRTYTLQAKTPGGARSTPLALDFATYVKPDDLKIIAVDMAGAQIVIFHSCRLQTHTVGDPTNGRERPPDLTIRQFTTVLPSGTQNLVFDYSGADSPTYLRIQGLCDFNIAPPNPSVGPQWRTFP